MITEANTPAFPRTANNSSGIGGQSGLTKREHFAGLAMKGLLAYGGTYWQGGISENLGAFTQQELATLAVSQADALIRALNKPDHQK